MMGINVRRSNHSNGNIKHRMELDGWFWCNWCLQMGLALVTMPVWFPLGALILYMGAKNERQVKKGA